MRVDAHAWPLSLSGRLRIANKARAGGRRPQAQTREAAINDKIAVSLAYSNISQQTGGSILDAHSVGDAAYNAAVAVIQGVTSDPSTATAAVLGINTAVAAQNLLLI